MRPCSVVHTVFEPHVLQRRSSPENGPDGGLGITVDGAVQENCVEMVGDTENLYTQSDMICPPGAECGDPPPLMPQLGADELNGSTCPDGQLPGDEACNGLDDDCDAGSMKILKMPLMPAVDVVLCPSKRAMVGTIIVMVRSMNSVLAIHRLEPWAGCRPATGWVPSSLPRVRRASLWC